jgi:DNA-binding response OmpR family regulator
VCVLLLEADRVSAEALALALEAADAEVAWVRSADEALQQGDALEPEAIVADLDAVPSEAEKLVRGMRERSPARRPVAVALSTDESPAARRRAREVGFDAYLARPFDPDRLVAVLRGLLARPRRVLVVDDNRDSADSLAMLLARRGFVVERAYDAAGALALARSFEPAVVVTDLRLGNGHGTELARALRALGRPLRIIAVSGASREDLPQGERLFDGFIRKPVDLDELVARVRSR